MKRDTLFLDRKIVLKKLVFPTLIYPFRIISIKIKIGFLEVYIN